MWGLFDSIYEITILQNIVFFIKLKRVEVYYDKEKKTFKKKS